jgi:hypothetical protein
MRCGMLAPLQCVLESFQLGRMSRGRRNFQIPCRGTLAPVRRDERGLNARMRRSGSYFRPFGMEFMVNANLPETRRRFV